MATSAASVPVMATDVKKLSFAKVAASGKKEPLLATTVARSPTTPKVKEARTVRAVTPVDVPSTARFEAMDIGITSTPAETGLGGSIERKPAESIPIDDSKVVESLTGLRLEGMSPSLVVDGSGLATTERSSKLENSQTPSDEASQRADSNSELGTKPPSLDGKSITSGTTFAMDEKESLRPDDSASVKAAADDDDAFSIRGSLIAGNSRMGSEVAPRLHRIQLGDMPPRTITSHALGAAQQTHNAAVISTGTSEKQPIVGANLPLATASAAPDSLNGNGFYSLNPDEKLLEAMQTPKDRLFLLRLEAQVIEFVQDSKAPTMDLPPCNSFCRMLTHKLADYYHMTHSFEPAGYVRIYRTPFCRVPAPLSSIVVNPSNPTSPAPVLLPRKIMRRGQDGELASSSASPSKPTSEAGSDKDKAARKEKLTREEREEAYNKARERIFGSLEKTENSPDNDDSNVVSRASSVSAREKTSQGKRKTPKQRRDDSESFDSRSAYVAWHGPQQPTWAAAPPEYGHDGTAQYNGQFQQPYPGNAMQPVYGGDAPYSAMVPNGGFNPAFNPVQQTYPPQVMPIAGPQQYHQQPRYQPQAAPVTSYAPPAPSLNQQTWSQPNFNQNQHQTRASPPSAGIPYAYGQLPVNVHPNDPKSQHPIPGSYNRHAFNPKTQSFVPGSSTVVPMHAPAPGAYPAAPHPHQGSPQFNPPHLNYTAYQHPSNPATFGGNTAGYGMAREGSSNSILPYHQGQVPPQLFPHSMHSGQQALPHNPMANIPNKPAMTHGPGQPFSTLPNYGNLATLPQKPAT